jgi:hypothetical protein
VKRVFTFRGCFGGLGEQAQDEVSNEQHAGQDIFHETFNLLSAG